MLYQNKAEILSLTKKGASHFAALVLKNIQREYPNKLSQVLPNVTKLLSPKILHPTFYGCFDWHSSVHGHWMLVRLLKDFPTMTETNEIYKKVGENLSAENIAGELAFFQDPNNATFERMYGWSWLLKLGEELYIWDDEIGQKWYQNLKPLLEIVVKRYLYFLPKQHYPIRTGTHANTAFGLTFAWDYANTLNIEVLKKLIEERAKDYYLKDCNCPITWEPSGSDFLSPCLIEADLMLRVLDKKAFRKWFKSFLPKKYIKSVQLAQVSDRSDPYIVHLDGLNLSRAWCLYRIASKLKNNKKALIMREIAKEHLLKTIPYVASGAYEGEHWLASFAVYALNT